MAKDEHKELPMRMNQGGLPPAVGLSGFELDMYRVQRNLYPAAPGGPPEEPPAGFALRDLLTPIFRHKIAALLVFLLISLGTAAYVASVPETYVSEAMIQLDEQRRNLVADPSGEGNSLLQSERGNASASSRSEISLLKSTNIAENVVDTIGVERLLSQDGLRPVGSAATHDFDYSQLNWFGKSLYWLGQGKQKLDAKLNLTPRTLTERERAILMVQKSLTVEPGQPGSPVLVVDYAALQPKLAQEVLSTILDTYVGYHLELNRVANPQRFKQQFEESQRIFEEAQAELDRQKKELDIVSLETQKETLVAQTSTLQAALDQTRRDKQSALIRMRALEETLEKPAKPEDAISAETRDPALDAIRAKIVDLKMQQIDLSRRYKAGSVPMQNLQNQIDELEGMLKDKASVGVVKFADPIRRNQELELATQKVNFDVNEAQEKELTKALENKQKELTKLTGNEGKIARMEREVQLKYEEMKQSQRSYTSVKHAEMLDEDRIANVKVLQSATLPPISAKNPRKLMAILFFGLFVGLFGGVAAAFALDLINHTIRSNEDVEKWLGLPVLAALPRSKMHLPELREDIL